jgi:hypothetical protein
LLNELFIPSSPRDFWSTRWHLLFDESLKGSGCLPVRNLFTPIFSRKIVNTIGVLSAFGVSGLLHEYFIIVILIFGQIKNFLFLYVSWCNIYLMGSCI